MRGRRRQQLPRVGHVFEDFTEDDRVKFLIQSESLAVLDQEICQALCLERFNMGLGEVHSPDLFPESLPQSPMQPSLWLFGMAAGTSHVEDARPSNKI